MDFLLRLISVSVLVTAAWGNIDMDVCTPIYKSCGLVPPPLPVNFELKGSFADKRTKSLGYEEIYFDFDHLRGKHMMFAEGIERHLIFDYNASQIVEYLIIHPGSTVKQDPLSFGCSAEEMEYSSHKNIFGYRYSGSDLITNTLMYDSAHVLRFGGPYQYAYNGSSSDDNSDDDRGLNWNAFIGCIYENDDTQTTALVRYKFSAENMLTSGGNLRTDIDGSGILDPLSVPLAVDYSGTQFVTDSNQKRTKAEFDISQSFSWFRANPVFDKKNLQIPPWIHCSKYRGWKRMPNFPIAFSVRVETSAYAQDERGKKLTSELLSVEDVYYYNEKGLARRDFTPHKERDGEILAEFGNTSPVKEVYDYVSLQIYTVNKATGQCFTRPLDQEAHFSKPNVAFTVMATPEELFLMQQEDMEYKGQYFARDIECDVWNGVYTEKEMNITFYKETYFTTNGWHSEVDENIEYSVPIKHSVITNQVAEEFFRTVVENNFFKFKAYAPVLAFFDISECVEKIGHSYFIIRLSVPEPNVAILQTYRFPFLETARYYLATVSDLVSPLRIQKLELSISKSGVLLVFAMIEKPPMRDGIVNPSKGVIVEDAVANLKKVVDEGNFEINFIHPLSKETIPFVAEPRNMFPYFPAGKVTRAKKIVSASFYAENEHHENKINYEYFDEAIEHILYDAAATTQAPKKQKGGMSAGGLAGLGIGMLLIGVAIGIAGMYLYFRKYGENSTANDYVMHSTN